MKPKMTYEERVQLEARTIAKDQLERFLESKNLPLPMDSALEIHINNLIQNNPSIETLAKERVAAKTDSYTIGLKALGIDHEIEEPLNIEIQI